MIDNVCTSPQWFIPAAPRDVLMRAHHGKPWLAWSDDSAQKATQIGMHFNHTWGVTYLKLFHSGKQGNNLRGEEQKLLISITAWKYRRLAGQCSEMRQQERANSSYFSKCWTSKQQQQLVNPLRYQLCGGKVTQIKCQSCTRKVGAKELAESLSSQLPKNNQNVFRWEEKKVPSATAEDDKP